MKLGVIGCGKMGAALLEGVISAGVFRGGDVVVTDVAADAAREAAKKTGASVAANNRELAGQTDVVLLCVKPADATAVLEGIRNEIAGKLVISIVAGLTLQTLERAAGESARVIRVMPNTPALVRKGATAYATGSKTTPDDQAVTERIFGAVGIVGCVKEGLLDAVTGLSGSGPAFVYVMIEALADAGVLMGLTRDLALQLAAQTVSGAAEMVLQTGTHPATLKDMVASPGGTTIAGLEALEQGGLRSTLMAAVRAAAERSRELGATAA